MAEATATRVELGVLSEAEMRIVEIACRAYDPENEVVPLMLDEVCEWAEDTRVEADILTLALRGEVAITFKNQKVMWRTLKPDELGEHQKKIEAVRQELGT